jgi:hypothetical protein
MRFTEPYGVPEHSLDVDDLEAQHSDDMEASDDSTEVNVEGGMTVAFKVGQPLVGLPGPHLPAGTASRAMRHSACAGPSRYI